MMFAAAMRSVVRHNVHPHRVMSIRRPLMSFTAFNPIVKNHSHRFLSTTTTNTTHDSTNNNNNNDNSRFDPQDQSVSRWLYASAALVFGMVVVGGVTRLTESGLSITDWKPLVGVRSTFRLCCLPHSFILHRADQAAYE